MIEKAMIETGLVVLTRVLQNQNALLYAELKHAEGEETRKLLSQSINETCELLGVIITHREGPGEITKEEEKE